MSKINLKLVDTRAELERLGWDVIPGNDSELKVKCPDPGHVDDSPSASISLKTNQWICFGCGAKGDIASFIAYATEKSRELVVEFLKTQYPAIVGNKVYPQATVEKFHQAIWSRKDLLTELYNRGITDEYIRQYRLGLYNDRITIPVPDLQYNIIGMRLYLPGAPGAQKMKNAKGFSKPQIYQVHQTKKYQKLWFCGGEMKAGAASLRLNKVGIGAFAITAGEGKGLTKDHITFLKGKDIYICMDVDKAGKNAASNYAKALSPHVNSVNIISLPLDVEKHPKGDVNDWIHEANPTPQDFLKLTEEAKPYEFTPVAFVSNDNTEAIEIELSETTNPEYFNKKLRTEGILSAVGDTEYFLPKSVVVACDRKQSNCGFCPINSTEEDPDGPGVTVPLNTCNPYYLSMMGAKDSLVRMMIQEALGIPRCKSVEFMIKSRIKIKEARLSPKLRLGEETKTSGTVRAFIVQDRIPDLGNVYKFTGSVFSSPKDQSVSLVFNDVELSDTSLNSYDPSDDELETLKKFQPKAWTLESLTEKLKHIYDDLCANVTHIYNRQALHTVIDLTYHSALMFSIRGKDEPGWVNSLIIGDSSQGKTATATALKNHYELGERVDCKNASIAGLIGGLQQIQKTWFISWGIFPSNDRGMLFLEEFKGLDIYSIGKMTDMRSSGIVEIPKIEKDKAYARTRMCALTNARSDKFMSEFSYGIEAIKELVGNPEDIRRFDIALVVATNQIDSDTIGEAFVKDAKVPHVYKSDLCRNLILFAWTRSKSEIKFQKEALEIINEKALKLSKKYSPKFPLLDTGTTRKKIARLSVALAIRTYSVNKNLKTVIVRPCHVQYISNFLNDIYSDPYFGYDRYSRDRALAERIGNQKAVMQAIATCADPNSAANILRMRDSISLQDMMDAFKLPRDLAQTKLSEFVQLGCLRREGMEYQKTSDFTKILRETKEWKTQEPEIPF